jgi:hypothetical protein
MTYLESNIFVFGVLPLIFILIWAYAFLYNRRIKSRIREIEGPGGHLASEEAGIAAAMQRSGKMARVR